ncbi:MAG: DUF4175 family protein [Candidatus Eisenbacteria bacterium]
MSGTTTAGAHAGLLSRINAAGRRWRRRAALTGALRVAAVLLAVVVAELVLDSILPLPSWARVGWSAGALLFLLVGSIVWIVRPLTRRIDAVRTAALIEREHPELGEMLESAAELGAARGRGKTGYSVELIDALIARVVSETTGLDLSTAGRDPGGVFWARVFAGTAVVCTLALLAVAPRLGSAVGRMVHPLSVRSEPAVRLSVAPGDVTLVAGDDLRVSATVEGPHEGAPSVRFDVEGELPLVRAMSPRDDGSYAATLRAIRAPLDYSVSAGDAVSPTYGVTLVERPFVTGIRLEYEFPPYSGLLPRTVDENTGDVTALAGTRVGLRVDASKPLERAWLAFADGESLGLERRGPATFGGELVVRASGGYSVRVVDRDGLGNPDPTEYTVVAIRDERPLVRIVEPGEDREVPRGMMLPLAVSAVDDYGVSSIAVRYSIQGRAEEGVVPVAEYGASAPREVARELEWDLAETGMLPGSVMAYFAEVTDNDAVSGPKTTRSESYLLRFPSMAELYSEVVGEQDDIVTDLDELVEEQEALRTEFEEIREEVRSDPSVDWQEQERVEEALERQELLAEDVSEMADRMSDLTDKMSESERVTMEALEKTEEITRLLDEVATEEMKELLEALREAMEKLSADDMSRAMDRMAVTQDDYLRRLEQTLNLLRRVKAEQQLADAANRAEDLAGREQEVAREAGENPGPEESESLAAEQERLRDAAEQLRKDIEKAISEMQAVDQEAAADMQKALDEMERSGTIDKMEKAGLDLAGGKPSEAKSQCESAANDLLALFTKLSSCQGGMSCSLNQRDRETTMRAIDELLGVSAEQEEIVTSVEGRERIARSEIVDLVRKETDLIEAMSAIAERTFEKSKDSFTIDPKLLRQIGAVQAMMSNAAVRIADGGTAAGRNEAKRALGGVNGLIVDLLSKNQGQSQGGGSAMQQLMQQLQQMARQQEALTDATEELRRQMEQSGMGAEMTRQLADIKARQEQMLEEARRLANEFGDRREILGRLDDTVDEMEATLAEMERSGASQETVDRQKRILSRLLDAQRSLRKRDYTKERRSREGESYSRTSPGALPDDLARASEELREDLLRAMQRDYPSEYRALIRAYFDGLARDAENGGGE